MIKAGSFILIAAMLLGGVPFAEFTVKEAAVPQAETVMHTVHQEDRKTPLLLSSVNGVTLGDDRQSVADKKGVPFAIQHDTVEPDAETYDYGYMSVTFSGTAVERVSIPAEADTFKVEGTVVSIDPASIREALGDPDYIAEDGLVYQRGELLLKVFLDAEKKRIVSIDYYCLANV
ncbi:hypothetical protein [Gorillibacterium massiliense]|uniref:hypothetical protein n=1 Tax=Gorillibacterium massiliense TaxID=1280390 RepID=UPI0004B037FC|nr:hypothetical protein [Gorillibacterium massiliense]